jgi:hypothetical protein
VKLDMPDTSKMTQSQRIDALQAAIIQTHGCLESHRDETRASFGVVTGKLGELATSLDVSNAYNAALAKRLNVDPKLENVKPAPGAWSLKKMAVVGLPCLSGVVLALQLLIPPIQAAAVAFYHALMAAH